MRVVNEAWASVYSASEIAREEFPELDATVRGTIELAKVHLSRIRQAMAGYREARSGPALRRALGQTVLATCAFAGAAVLLADRHAQQAHRAEHGHDVAGELA